MGATARTAWQVTRREAGVRPAAPGRGDAGKLSDRGTGRRATRRADTTATLPEPEEQALVARAKAGDRAAFEVLVRHNADRLHAVVLRFSASESDAEEATQEAFVRAWRSLSRFRGDARFFTWLYRIGVNEAKRIAERGPSAGTVVSVEERPVDDIADDEPGPQPRAERTELRDVLEQVVRRLPEKYRTAVVLRDIEGLSTSEAAAALGLHEAALKSRLRRGRMALRRELAGYVLGEDVDAGARDAMTPERRSAELS
jgi:RNA polymerase sigma-70 factor (ECF subfamily)